ncbi:glycosyltransferase [Haemophilus haemolyticus]|uniref:glycosyltransferase n=1 Tax=Haemophilus haemolyticus TaxID=726 RepID=UPI00211B9A60|nr:glycosyltransferase [Haemophilus haemolyticus]
MINILIVHSTLSPPFGRGGVETVLISYLKIFSKLVDSGNYKVDLLLLKEVTESDLSFIPNNINTKFNFRGLSSFEEMFQIYCSIERKKENYSSEEKAFFESWDDAITNYCNSAILEVINSGDHNLIINFDNYLDSFLKKYDITNKLPVIRWIHSDTNFTIWKNDLVLYKYLLNKHSYFINICDEMTKKCSEVLLDLGINKSILTLVNPIDKASIEEKLSHQEKNVSDSDKVLLSQDYILQVARLFDYKDHFTMLDIYSQLKQKGVKEKLYIIGDGPNYSKLEERIKDLGLEGDCLLLGRRDNPYLFMKYAKLFIHTSWSEGLPTVFLESMVCGTPVVSMDCPTGPKDILGNGRFGSLVPLGDKITFVNQVYELLNNNEKREVYIQRLPEAIERFNIDKISNELEKLLITISKSVQ